MNETECANLLASVQWTDPTNLVSLAVLAFINVLVIVGNCLVIAAVLCSHKLRSVTNFFIVSLAVADLLVGLAVLPFSATWEVFKVWIFGDVWCRIWLAVDVWMCTASILNLCAISLDRYVAVTRPVTYPSIMSTRRAKSLIAGLWVLSFVICFPPLVGWKEQKVKENVYYQYGNYTLVSVTPTPMPPLPCPWTCELTNDAGYVVYSALGSFYIPMFVMLFFYWRIYRAAVRTTRAINQGFRTTKGGKNNLDDSLTLRMHRGKGVASLMESTIRAQNAVRMSLEGSQQCTGTPGASAHPSPAPQISISRPSSGNVLPTATPATANRSKLSLDHQTRYHSSQQQQQHQQQQVPTSRHHQSSSRRKSVFKEAPVGVSRDLSPNSSKKLGKRHLKVQVKRFRMETKAAKTLGIIVGGFIFCWLPFFTMYLVRPFCGDCINELLFSVLFWLGYCNSAVNPFIYALFSKDFRQAFKRIILRCLCSRRVKLNLLLKKNSAHNNTANHSYSPSAFTPTIVSAARATDLDEPDDADGGGGSACR
ncbi:octopamine receptor Oamb-like isoform X2 [Anopheles aquasalis]|uniref:octopamine receptor Oamb-like isoform X2 n=1 Tax=Anopheles aquasalis TaxID=42839 RepID=UPI00215A6331|nr:octopamine receptor Oamb-like isoform X2 [Anopheles aquasalis]